MPAAHPPFPTGVKRAAACALLALTTWSPLAAVPLPSRRSDIVEVVEKVSPAVVNIAAEQMVRRRSGLWDDFFFGLDPRPRRDRAQSLGSGAIIDPRGIILTLRGSSRRPGPEPSSNARSSGRTPTTTSRSCASRSLEELPFPH